MENPLSGDQQPQNQPTLPKTLALALVFFVILAGIISLGIYRSKHKPDLSGEIRGDNNQQKADLKKFKSYQDLVDFLRENSSNDAAMNSGMMRKEAGVEAPGFAPTQGLSSEAMPMQSNDSAGSASPDYSRTNVQVEGVDEADIIKTDGQYIYAVVNQDLFVLDAYPAEKADILAKVEFKSRPQDLYIDGDRLAIFGSDQEIQTMDFYKNFQRQSAYTFLKIFDISDRKNPKQLQDYDFEGNYFQSRMINGQIYFLTETYASYFDNEIPVPRVLANGQELYNPKDNAKCNRCPDVYYFDIPYDNFNYLNVATVNIKGDKDDLKNQIYLVDQAQNLYVSEKNLYVTYTRHISQYDVTMQVTKDIVLPKLSNDDQDRIAKIEETERFILSDQEKLNKISRIVERYKASLSKEERKNLDKEIQQKMKQKYEDLSKELEKTVIHKIAIDKGKLEYQAKGEVTGSVLNQFSMDENDGYFRIVTTKNRDWWGPVTAVSRESDFVGKEVAPSQPNESYNNLYVLDKDMKTIGKVEDLAFGEKIYSVRFMQNRAYMVTFKQVDPLFVIGLDDPKNPQVLGKLKIPGFSNYLHPYDEKTIIGIGKATQENSSGGVTTGGVKLSLFDVSDVSNPREIDNYVLGEQGSDSIALNDHKAFLFSKEKNLLVIPVTLTNNSRFIEPMPMEPLDDSAVQVMPPRPIPTTEQFDGAMVFRVDGNGFQFKGKIAHSDNEKEMSHEYWYGPDYYDTTVKRSLYINDMLYTFSSRYLQANKLDDLAEIKKVKLQKENDFRVIN